MNLSDLFVTPPSERIVTWGLVTSTSPTMVRVAGDVTDTQVDSTVMSYTPAAGDKVILMRLGSAWLIMGGFA